MLKKVCSLSMFTAAILVSFTAFAFAQEPSAAAQSISSNTMAAAFCIFAAALGLGIACVGVGVGQGMAVAKSVEAVGRNPESTAKVQMLMIIGLAFLETVVIYSLTVSLLLMFENPFIK